MGFFTLALSLLGITVELFMRSHFKIGFEALAISAFIVAGDLTFLMPMQCRVETAKHLPCRLEAYGFLLGCHTSRHGIEKFYARLTGERGPYNSFAHGSSRQDTPGNYSPSPYDPEAGIILITSEGQDRLSVFVSIGTLAMGAVSAIASVLAVH
jgi:hypothetical protein